MRWIIILLLSISIPVLSQTDKGGKKKEKTKKETSVKEIGKFLVSGKITQTSSHCGGMEIGPDATDRLNTPVPLAEKKLYIKKGEKNNFKSSVILEVTTDTTGKFVISLPPGKYFVVDEKRKDETFYNNVLKKHGKKTEWYSAVDEKCLTAWYEKPDFVFEVKSIQENFTNGLSKININYHNSCSWDQIPCSQYSGPLPP